MRTVLGIDRAWTRDAPSGVALLVERGKRWVCEGLAGCMSHEPFVASDELKLLETIRRQGYPAPSVIAIDMPMARSPIVARRVSDDKVSLKYGGRKCGTHSPSSQRPGVLATEIRISLQTQGYALRTRAPSLSEDRHLLEVYPHPAILHLLQCPERLPYKVGKTNTYWPGQSLERRLRLVAQALYLIVEGLRKAGIDVKLEPPNGSTLAGLKEYEDKVDALVCAWTAVQFLRGRAVPFGDDESAIWIPLDNEQSAPASL